MNKKRKINWGGAVGGAVGGFLAAMSGNVLVSWDLSLDVLRFFLKHVNKNRGGINSKLKKRENEKTWLESII